MAYIESCSVNIRDANDMKAIIVDNCEDSFQGLQYIKKEIQDICVLPCNITQKIVYSFTWRTVPCLYVCVGENIGYAKGNMLGAEISEFVFHHTYYLFSNNDLKFKETWSIRKLLDPMKSNPQIAVVGPHIVGVDGEQQSPNLSKSVWNRMFLYYYAMLLPKCFQKESWISHADKTIGSKICDWLSGSFLLINAERFWKAGGFDPHTFLFAEEIILAKRLERCGYYMYYEDKVSMIHEHGATVKSVMNEMKGIKLSFYASLYYYHKYENVNNMTVFLAKLNFKFFYVLFSFKKILKDLLFVKK